MVLRSQLYSKSSEVVWLSHSHTCCSDHDLILGKTAVIVSVSFIRGLNPIMWPCWSVAPASSGTSLHHDCCCLVAKSCPTLWDPMDCSLPGWNWLPFPSLEDRPRLGIKPSFPVSPALAGRSLPLGHLGRPLVAP